MALSIDGTTGISGVDGSASAPALQGTDSNTGVSFGADILAFNVGGSEKARVHSNGNFGIGRSDPDQKLVVRGSGTTILKVENSDDGTAQLTLGNTGSSNLAIQQVGGATIFQQGGSERMRLDNDGTLVVGYAGSASGLAHFGSSTTSYIRMTDLASDTNGIVIRKAVSSTYAALRLVNTNGHKGNLNVSNSGVSLANASDYRLKENETTISNGITRVKQLIPRRFNFKTDSSNTVDGFFAHEVTPVVPEAVFGEKDATIDSEGDGYQMLDQSKLIPVLTAALKEAVAKIEVLETKVAALEAK